MFEPWHLPLLFGTGLVAGFVDSIAGGGGLISVPVLLSFGLDAPVALGTNKLQAAVGSGSAAWHYARAKTVPLEDCARGFVLSLLGAALGTLAVERVDPSFLKRFIPILLLAVAAYLKAHGANVLLVAEQTTKARLMRFSSTLWRFPGKLAQAIQLRNQLAGVPYVMNCWPISAAGSEQLERVTLQRDGKPLTIECDYLACGFHLVPNVELATLLGCDALPVLVDARCNHDLETGRPRRPCHRQEMRDEKPVFADEEQDFPH